MAHPPHHANSSKTLFQNPWKTAEEPDENATEVEEPAPEDAATQAGGVFNLFANSMPSWLLNIPIEIAKDLSHHNILPKKVVEPRFYKYAGNEGSLKATWLGHAVSACRLKPCSSDSENDLQSMLLEMKKQKDAHIPMRILFDPMFSDRAGPSAWTGIRRRLPPPCSIADLPEYQFVLISHNQYEFFPLGLFA